MTSGLDVNVSGPAWYQKKGSAQSASLDFGDAPDN